jgi:hypothetical protein
VLAVPDHVAEPGIHAGIDMEHLGLGVPHLVIGELAGEEPGRVRPPEHELRDAFDEAAEGVVGAISGMKERDSGIAQGVDQTSEHLSVEGFLVGEVVVEEGGVDSGGGGDLLDRGAAKALPRKELFGGVEDRPAGVGVGHGTN